MYKTCLYEGYKVINSIIDYFDWRLCLDMTPAVQAI